MLVLSDMSCLVSPTAIKGSQLCGCHQEKGPNVTVTDPERQGSHHVYHLQGDVGTQISLL